MVAEGLSTVIEVLFGQSMEEQAKAQARARERDSTRARIGRTGGAAMGVGSAGSGTARLSAALAEVDADAAVAQPPPASDICLSLCLRDPPARAMLSPAQQRFVESVVNCTWHWLWQQVSVTLLRL